MELNVPVIYFLQGSLSLQCVFDHLWYQVIQDIIFISEMSYALLFSDVSSRTTEDDITVKLTEIILINEVLRKHKRDGAPVKIVTETWDHLQVCFVTFVHIDGIWSQVLQIQVALYFNSELSGLHAEQQPKKVCCCCVLLQNYFSEYCASFSPFAPSLNV